MIALRPLMSCCLLFLAAVLAPACDHCPAGIPLIHGHCEDQHTDPVEIPDAAQPDASQPDASQPDASQPDASQPDASQPDASEPDASEPDASEPVCVPELQDTCGDGIDNDCDGEIDEADASCDQSGFVCVDARCVPNGDFTGALETPGGFVLTMVDGGGFGTPFDAMQTALHTDAISDTGANEQFEIVWQDDQFTSFALKTADGLHYVTAVNGGGIGGPNNGTCPIHTDSRTAGGWETVRLRIRGRHVSIQTDKGTYVTAVDGGGIDGPDTVPIRTSTTVIADNEVFKLRVFR